MTTMKYQITDNTHRLWSTTNLRAAIKLAQKYKNTNVYRRTLYIYRYDSNLTPTKQPSKYPLGYYWELVKVI